MPQLDSLQVSQLLQVGDFIAHICIPSTYQRSWPRIGIGALYTLANKTLQITWTMPSLDGGNKQKQIQDCKLTVERGQRTTKEIKAR